MEKFIGLLFFSVVAVTANVCKSEGQEVGSSLSGSLEISGNRSVYFFDIFNDDRRDLLYFVGYFHQGPPPWNTIIYKSNHKLESLKIMTYDIYIQRLSNAFSPNGDFFYTQDRATNKIVEIRTSDLTITRELQVIGQTSGNLAITTDNWKMKVASSLFFSQLISSVLETCKWDTSTVNLVWFSFGVENQTNFFPVNDDLLFVGSVDIQADQYYLGIYNFSDTSNLGWKKSISCPTSDWVSKISNSILSLDEEWILVMILYDEHYIFYKLSVTDGSPQNSGFIWNDSGYLKSNSMGDFKDFVAIKIDTRTFSLYTRLILISHDRNQMPKEFKSVNSQAYGVGRMLLNNGQELMFHSGRIKTNFTIFFARTPTNNIDQLREFEQDAPLFAPITTSYQLSNTSSNPSITQSMKTLIISSSTSLTSTDITSSTDPSMTIYVALWNQDHIQSVQSNSSAQIDFTWAWAQSANYTDITFELTQTGSHQIPDWVNMDTNKQELRLNTTPKLTEATKFYFSLKILFDSEVHYKNFQITVEEWNILNCEVWQLGTPDQCETCEKGYKRSSDQQSWPKITSMAGTTQAATAMVTSSVMLASASSMISLSSINSIFSIMNSMQLGILLPMVPEYFSPKVLDYLSGMGFAMMSFDFIKLEDVPFVKSISDWVSYPQSDEYLNSLGLRSGSSVVNYLSLMAVLILIAVVHFAVIIWVLWTANSKHKKCNKFFGKLLKFLTFNIYIRVFIQAFSFTSLSILAEIYTLNLDTTVTRISFGLWVLFALGTSVLFILSFYMYYKSFPDFDKEKYWPCAEYFNGVKPTKFSKLYSSIFMSMRLMLACLLIFGRTISGSYRSTCFYLINIGYALYLLCVRPFENPQDSVIEIINQILFCFLAVPLYWLNTEESWTSFYESYYTTIFMVSPAIWSLICLAFLVKSIVSYCIRRKAKKSQQNIAPKKPLSNPGTPQNQYESDQAPTPSVPNPPPSISASSISMVPPPSSIQHPQRKFGKTKTLKSRPRP